MSKYVLVDAISQFRMRYVIEVPDDHNDGEYPCSATEWAEDSVTCEEAKEFSQKHLGETIVASRVIDKQEIIRLCDEDNDYLTSWTEEQKMNLVTPIGYKKED